MEQIDEWTKSFKQAQEELDEIEIPEVLQISEGEVIEAYQVNVELLKNAKAFQRLGRVKDQSRELESTAKRWYEQARARAILDLLKPGQREVYSSDELRKAYAEDRSIKFRELWDAAKILAASIHDERQRLFQYRADLENIGHNIRAGMKLI